MTSTSFWLKDPMVLFKNLYSVIPSRKQSTVERLNTLTRLTLIAIVVFSLMGNKQSLTIGVVVLLLIISYYYFLYDDDHHHQRSQQRPFIDGPPMFVENFEICGNTPKGPLDAPRLQPFGLKEFTGPPGDRFAHDRRCINSEAISTNQALVPGPNPKVFIDPVIAPPIKADDYWRANEFVYQTGINDQGIEDMYRSGYYVPPRHKTPLELSGQTYVPTLYNTVTLCGRCGWNDCSCTRNCDECGFRKCICRNLQSGLPSNLRTGPCQTNPIFEDYNRNLTTQQLQPGVYTQSKYFDPINSNIGISYTPQFENVQVVNDRRDGGVRMVSHAPQPCGNNYTYVSPVNQPPSRSNVYDPRLTGYGPQNRSYFDPMTGQTRYYYDDVNTGNFLIRSHVDTLPFSASGFGPMRDPNIQQLNNTNSRYLADKSFIDNTSNHRVDLQSKLMRKYNNTIGFERRRSPIHTMY